MFEIAISVGKALFDIISEAVGANEKKIEELGLRVEAVLTQGITAIKLARAASAADDATTRLARDEALRKIRTRGRGEA